MNSKENIALQRFIRDTSLKAKESNHLILNLNDPETVKALVMRSTDDINRLITAFLIGVLNRRLIKDLIKFDKLYLIPCEKKAEGWECVLGEDILLPNISMFTVNQLHELYAWQTKISLKDRQKFKNFDYWVECLLGVILKKALDYSIKISLPVRPLQEVLKEVGENANDLRKKLKIVAINSYMVRSNNIVMMKKLNTPEFLVSINIDENIKLKKIVRNLSVDYSN